jgi:hypothetical protein
LLAAAQLSAQTTTTYLTDSFASASVTAGSSSVAAGVSSATQWYESAASNLSLNGQALNIASGNAAYVSFFSSSPVSIATPGTTIDFSFDLSTTATPANNTFKIALFDSQANLTGNGFTRPTINSNGLISPGSSGDTAATASKPYLNWSGYYLNFNPLTAGGNSGLQFAQRANSTANTSFMTNSGSQSVLGSNSLGTGLAANTVYHLDFSITYDATSQLVFNASITDGLTTLNQATYTLASIPVVGGTSFDTIAFNPNVSSTAGWKIDNLNVSATAVPEPSTYALIAGMVMLAGVAFRRRFAAA